MAPDELAGDIDHARGRGGDRVPVEVSAEVVAHRLSGGVALVRVFGAGLEDDAVEVAAEGFGLGGCEFGAVAGDLAGACDARVAVAAAGIGGGGDIPGEELAEDRAQRVDIDAGIAGECAGALFGAHVAWRAEADLRLGERAVGVVFEELGDAEVDDAGAEGRIVLFDEDVCGLEIPMDHGPVVRVLDGIADLGHQLDALPGVEAE